MSDMIDREEAYKVLSDYYHHKTDAQHEALKEALDRVPSVEPKKGRWTIETIGEIPRYRDTSIYEPIYRCSCCGLPTESYVRFDKPTMPEDADFPRYCPHCGAKMEVTE